MAARPIVDALQESRTRSMANMQVTIEIAKAHSMDPACIPHLQETLDADRRDGYIIITHCSPPFFFVFRKL